MNIVCIPIYLYFDMFIKNFKFNKICNTLHKSLTYIFIDLFLDMLFFGIPLQMT